MSRVTEDVERIEQLKDEMLDEAIGSFTEAIKPLNLTAEDVIEHLKNNCKEGVALLTVQNLSKRFGKKQVLNDIHLTRKRGSDGSYWCQRNWENNDYELYCRTTI